MFTFLYIINLLFISPIVFGVWRLIFSVIPIKNTITGYVYSTKSFYKKLWGAGLISLFVFFLSLGLTQFIILDMAGFNFDSEFDGDDYTLDPGDYHSIDTRDESNMSNFDMDVAIVGSPLCAILFSQLTYKYLRAKILKSYTSLA